MAYSKKNKLKRIIVIQEQYTKYKLPGVSHVHVFKEHIYPIFHISQRTLEEYLATPAVKLLKQLEDGSKNQTNAQQISMGFDEPTVKDDAGTGTS